MATTISPSSTGSEPVVSTAMPAETRRPRADARRSRLWAVVLIPAAGVAAGLAWAVVNWAGSTKELAGIEKFTVVPRSFSVVLNEKGELKASRSTDIVCEVEGRSTIIYLIAEGTAVKKGDLLVELASDQIEDRIRQEELKEANAITAFEAAKTELEIQRDKNASDIRKADLQIELKRLALDKYEKGDWEQALKDAQIEIERASIALERRTEDFQAAKKLIEKDFITKTEYEQDEFNYKKAQWDLEKAKKALEVLTEYTHKADLRQRQSDLEEAIKERERIAKNAQAEEIKKVRALEGKGKELELIQDQLGKLRAQKDKCRIAAPGPGFVVYYSEGWRWGADDQIKEGATVHERQVLMQLPDTSEMKVVVRIHEAKTDKLSLGQPALINVEGMPGQRFTGKVTKIAVVADTQNRWLNPDLKEYETEIALDSTDASLKPGVTAHVEILVTRVEDKLAVPVQTVYSKTGRRYVFSEGAHGITPIEVKLGAIGTEWAEVRDGLSGGERILLAFAEEHKRLIPDLPTGSRRDVLRWGARGEPAGRRGGEKAAVQRRGRPKGAHRGHVARGKATSKSAGSP